MSEIKFQANLTETHQYLRSLLLERCSQKSIDWLDSKTEILEKNYEEKKLFMFFSMASRFFEKKQLAMSSLEKEQASAIRQGFAPSSWDALQTARTILLLSIPYADFEQQVKTLDTLFESADVAELVALYAALPLLPNPVIHIKRAAEGIRTNMTIVLDAVALNNPFPSEYFDEISWNQLVLKSIFTERPVYQIYNADTRANERLAATLSDYAHERWAAGRAVTPELWRFTGQFANETLLADYQKLFESGSPLEKNAALLACEEANTEQSNQLLETFKPKVQKLLNSWDELGKAYQAEKGPLPSGYQQAGSGVSKPDEN